MATKATSPVKKFPDDSIEKRTYILVESLSEFIPVPNDRNRLAYGLVKYLEGEGDPPSILLKSAKVQIKGIDIEALAEKISEGIK